MQFVWDSYREPWQDQAAWANRSGLKTLCSSIIAALEFMHCGSHLRGRVLSGSEDQARNLYGYWEDWCFGPLKHRLQSDPGRQLTRLDNGDFEILSASQKRVRGAKVQRLFRDEIDEMPPDIYAASVGMLASMGDTPARTIDTSTWHHPYGPMGQLVEEADKRGIRLHKWNVWESIAGCPPERHDEGRNCEACPLGAVCLPKSREVHGPGAIVGLAADCLGLFAIDDAIKQFRQWSLQQWQAEAECKRPSLEGMVYPQFERGQHVKPDLDFQDALPIYRTIDWGLNNFVCLWLQATKGGQVHVLDEYCAENATVTANAEAIKRIDGQAAIEATYCDPAGRNRNDQTGYSDIQVFRSLGIPCRYNPSPWAIEVHNGINLIRGALQPAAGPPRLFIAPKCKQTIKAFESYRLRMVNEQYVDEPVKPQPADHIMDALRYFFVNRMMGPQVSSKTIAYSGATEVTGRRGRHGR